MFNRRGSSSDQLGMDEPLNEQDKSNQPIKTSHRYFLKFTPNREQAFKTIFEHSIGRNLNPMTVFAADSYTH